MDKIIGRRDEIAELEELYSNGRSEFVVLYGRRRVGKTFLVNEIFKDRFTFTHTALSPVEIKGKELMKMQLRHFCHSLIRHSNCSSYVNCGGDQLTEMEAEMLRLFRSFDMRKKTEAMACLFRIEDNMKGVDNLG